MSGKWQGRTRTGDLPPDWSERRAKRKRIAGGRCEAEVHEPDCDGIGRECDHHVDRNDHRVANLRWLSTPCHKAKTQREAQAARPTTRRPTEAHPGLL